MARLSRRFASVAGALLLVFLLMSGVARAAGVVTNCSGYLAPNGLFEALIGGGTVTFTCSGTIVVPEIDITTSSFTFDGAGQSVTLSGNRNNGVFKVSAGATLNLRNLTVANGFSVAAGAGVNNAGTLTVTNCTFSNNDADLEGGVGGAIFNSGTATITNSTFTGNNAEFGGAIYTNSALTNGVTLTVSNSTFSGNTSDSPGRVGGNGGAIGNNGDSMIFNSTFSGNSAAVSGGGVENGTDGTLSITNSTFRGNIALAGAGVQNDAVAGIGETG